MNMKNVVSTVGRDWVWDEKVNQLAIENKMHLTQKSQLKRLKSWLSKSLLNYLHTYIFLPY